VKRLIYILPALAFLGLAYVLLRSLLAPPPDTLASALIDKPAPRFDLPALDAAAQSFSTSDLGAGHVTVMNVFASWCVPCRAEAPVLETIAGLKDVALYGLVYKDTPFKARAFLSDVGNPFTRIDIDADGRASLNWGVYGVPETYIIDPHGIIRERFVGEITPQMLVEQVLPAIDAARARN